MAEIDPGDIQGFDSDTGKSKYPRDKFKVGDRVKIVRFNVDAQDEEGPDDRLLYKGMIGKIVNIELRLSRMYPYQILLDNVNKEDSLNYRYEQSEIELAGPMKIDTDGNLV